jgi:hypothetical protein
MPEKLSPTCTDAPQLAPRRNGWTALSASLVTAIALLWPDPALAQSALLPNMQSLFGLDTASPLSSGYRPSARIPLGSTEIATPGISPIVPSQNACASAANARSSHALFDGGGSTSLCCADSKNILPSLSSSPVDRTGIPMCNAGINRLSAPASSASIP